MDSKEGEDEPPKKEVANANLDWVEDSAIEEPQAVPLKPLQSEPHINQEFRIQIDKVKIEIGQVKIPYIYIYIYIIREEDNYLYVYIGIGIRRIVRPTI